MKQYKNYRILIYSKYDNKNISCGMRDPKEKIDLPNERQNSDTNSIIPVNSINNNPLLRNKGQVSKTPVCKYDKVMHVIKDNYWSHQPNSERLKANSKDSIGTYIVKD